MGRPTPSNGADATAPEIDLLTRAPVRPDGAINGARLAEREDRRPELPEEPRFE